MFQPWVRLRLTINTSRASLFRIASNYQIWYMVSCLHCSGILLDSECTCLSFSKSSNLFTWSLTTCFQFRSHLMSWSLLSLLNKICNGYHSLKKHMPSCTTHTVTWFQGTLRKVWTTLQTVFQLSKS